MTVKMYSLKAGEYVRTQEKVIARHSAYNWATRILNNADRTKKLLSDVALESLERDNNLFQEFRQTVRELKWGTDRLYELCNYLYNLEDENDFKE